MRLDNVLIGMDFSPTAKAAAKWVVTSLDPHAKLALVHVIEPPAKPAFVVADTLPAEALELDAIREAMDGLREVATTLEPNVTRLDTRIGRAADVLKQTAIDACADLLVVGPHGNRAHRSLLLGTTADALARNAATPVLIGARAQLRGRTRVVVGVTDAPISARLLEWADAMVRRLGGRLTVVSAIEPAAYSHMASLAAARAHGDEIVERLTIDGERHELASERLAECTRAGIDSAFVDVVAEEGLPAEVILREAAKERAALIILGRHQGAPGLPPRLGSTVRRVLHEARGAVLVVPEE